MRFYYTVYSRYNYLQSITYISSASKYNVKHSINWILNVEMLLPNTPWCSWCNANTVVSLTTVICQWSQPEKWEDSESRLSSQSVRWITYINDKYWYPYFLYFLQIDNLISLYNNNWQGRTNQIYFSLYKWNHPSGLEIVIVNIFTKYYILYVDLVSIHTLFIMWRRGGKSISRLPIASMIQQMSASPPSLSLPSLQFSIFKLRWMRVLHHSLIFALKAFCW